MFTSEEKIKTVGAGVRRIYFFAVLALQIIAYPIIIFNVGEFDDQIYFALIVTCFLTSHMLLSASAQKSSIFVKNSQS